MQSRIMIEKPAEVTLTLKLQATAAEFEQLRDEISQMPSEKASHLRAMLNDLLSQVRHVFYPESAPKHVATFMGAPFYICPTAPDATVNEMLRRLANGVPTGLSDT